MAVGSIILPNDTGRTGKHQPTRTKTDTDSVLKHFPRIVIEPKRQVVNKIAITTPRTLGSGSGTSAHTQNIFSIENQLAGIALLAIRRMTIQLDQDGAVLTAVAPMIKIYRLSSPNLPGGGTELTGSKVRFDTFADATDDTTVARAATASDAGAATPITASSIGSPAWSQLVWRRHSNYGQLRMEDEAVIPVLSNKDPMFLRPGEALLVQISAVQGDHNPVGNNWIVNCMLEEFTEF
jgi:hypothetical protein